MRYNHKYDCHFLKRGNIEERNGKVVFILGSGFSNPALGFCQRELLKKVREEELLDPAADKFIYDVYGSSNYVPLEDIYTLLDRCIDKRESAKGTNVDELEKIRNQIDLAIAKLHEKFTSEFLNKYPNNYIKKFAQKLVSDRWKNYLQRGRDGDDDRFSILSLNWDTLVERELGLEMDKNKTYWLPTMCSNQERKMFMDFCMFDFRFGNSKYPPTSLRIKAMGFANLKILKLHGSFNWVQCPNCQGVFVNLENEPFELPFTPMYCSVCQKNKQGDYIPKQYIITPTFLKDFSSTHFRSIWWNAGYEIAEASHIVFIGYSLPQADYDLRFLLSKNIQKTAKVTAVLKKDDKAQGNYQDFFGDKVMFCDKGVEIFIDNLDLSNLIK